MKKKRILCVEVSGKCRNLREVGSLRLASLFNVRKVGSYCSSAIGWKRISKRKCKNCTEAEYGGITREQAIEKMAHALCVQSHGPCESCEQVAGGNTEHCNDYRAYAEAALNALLEGNNEN